MNEALRDWVANVHDTFYIIGTAAGPHPYPELVRDFQSVIGTRGARADAGAHRPPARPAGRGDRRRIERDRAVPPVPRRCRRRDARRRGGGPRARQASTPRSLAGGFPGVLHGNKTYLLQDEDGQIAEAHSISAGLDYPGIGPEHAWLQGHRPRRIYSATDTEALDAFQLLCRTEGIIPALEPSHAIAAVTRKARGDARSDQVILANLCGRGDKDIFTVAEALGVRRCDAVGVVASRPRFAQGPTPALVAFVTARRPVTAATPRPRSSTRWSRAART